MIDRTRAHVDRSIAPLPYRRRAVALYALCMFLAIVIVSAGVGLINIQRGQRRTLAQLGNEEQAYALAQSGLEWALLQADIDTSWRSRFTSGVGVDLTIPGVGVCSVTMTDADGALADSEADPVTIDVAAQVGDTLRSLEAVARPGPHPALKYALYAPIIAFTVDGSVISGPIYATTIIWAPGRTLSVTQNGAFEGPPGVYITSTLSPQSNTAPVISRPAVDVAAYVAAATTVASGGSGTVTFKKANLTPTVNSEGAVNANGIYFINTTNSDVKIEHVHVQGTLIIRATGSKTIEFSKSVVLEPGPAGHPTLIIDAPTCEVKVDMDESYLEESSSEADADLNGDGDRGDSLPTKFTGIIWTNTQKDVLAGNYLKLSGLWISNRISVEGATTFDDLRSLAYQPLPGFRDGKLHLMAGSIRE